MKERGSRSNEVGRLTLKIIKAQQDVPSMSEAEIEEFLASSKLLLRIRTVDARGEANIHPIWFYYENGRLYIFADKGTRKAQNIERRQRVYFSVDTDQASYRGVKGKATARFQGFRWLTLPSYLERTLSSVSSRFGFSISIQD